MSPLRRILSVGQCSFDHARISSALRDGFGAEVRRAHTHDEALSSLRDGPRFDLILVNRVGDLDGTPGIDLIRKLKADPALESIPVMLVSNYPEAQAMAQGAGARAGFGKDDLGTSRFRERVAAAIAPDDAPAAT